MLLDDILLLRCVDCGGDLRLWDGKVEKDVVIFGLLECVRCKSFYPIIEEIAVVFKKDTLVSYLGAKEMSQLRYLGYDKHLHLEASDNTDYQKQVAVAKNWEYQWGKLCNFNPEDLEKDNLLGKRLFWSFIPIEPKLFKDKVVFIACGGMGREAYHISKEQPAKIIVSEIGNEIYSIKKMVQDPKRILLIRSDVSHHPLKPETADISICDHALQHVLDHKLAYSAICEATKKGGKIGVCVYSYENNFLMTHIIEPSKVFLHLFPLRVQRYISFIPALIIYILIHGAYLPLSRLLPKVACKLPLFDHMIFWSKNDFKIVWLSCFDLIHAPISYHFKKEEICNLASRNGLSIEKIVHTHGTTWSLVASKG